MSWVLQIIINLFLLLFLRSDRTYQNISFIYEKILTHFQPGCSSFVPQCADSRAWTLTFTAFTAGLFRMSAIDFPGNSLVRMEVLPREVGAKSRPHRQSSLAPARFCGVQASMSHLITYCIWVFVCVCMCVRACARPSDCLQMCVRMILCVRVCVHAGLVCFFQRPSLPQLSRTCVLKDSVSTQL